MSDLEFQRELSPDQLNEALSLLDGGAKIKDPQAPGQSVAEEPVPGAGELRAPVAARDRLFAAEDPHKRLNRAAIAFYGIATAATLALLSWGGPQLAHPAPGLGSGESQPAVAGSSPGHDGETVAGSDVARSPDATPPPPQASAAPTTAESRSGQNENRKRPSRHVYATKQRSQQRHPQARAEIAGGACPYFECLWPPRRVAYDPPRGLNQ